MFSDLKSNRKGNAFFDVATIVIIIFTLGVAFLSFYDDLGDINTDLNSDDMIRNESKEYMNYSFDTFPSIVDSSMIIILIIAWISAIAMALFIDAQPVFIPVVGILVSFIIYISAELSNTFFNIVDSSNASLFPYTTFIINHIVIISAMIGASVMLAMYAKLSK